MIATFLGDDLMDEEETEQERQCASCGQWFDECDIIGDVCADCHATVIDNEAHISHLTLAKLRFQ